MDELLDPGVPAAVALRAAIQAGDVPQLRRLLTERPGLARVRIRDGDASRTLLHIVTDWPGHFSNGPEVVRLLVAAGADVDAPFTGSHAETPLHWAASSDDVAVLDALLDAGADIEAPGSIIDGGTPLADAVAFAQWNAARRLAERGASANLWQAAGLGDLQTTLALLAAEPVPGRSEITRALWCACHGGRHDCAVLLIERGGDFNWIGYDGLTAIQAAQRSHASGLATWLRQRGARTAAELQPRSDGSR